MSNVVHAAWNSIADRMTDKPKPQTDRPSVEWDGMVHAAAELLLLLYHRLTCTAANAAYAVLMVTIL